MAGEVEVDETYIGGKSATNCADTKLGEGRGPVGKKPVMGFRERKTGSVRDVSY